MQRLAEMIVKECYDCNLGRAVAMATGYFEKEENCNPEKSYTIGEVVQFMNFLFDVRGNELDLERKATMEILTDLEKEFSEEEHADITRDRTETLPVC